MELRLKGSQFTTKNLLIIVFSCMIVTQILYTWQNVTLFRNEYSQLTNDQAKELGRIIKNEISIAFKFNLPLEKVGRVDIFLNDIVKSTQNIAFIDIVKAGTPIFSSIRARPSVRTIQVPIPGKTGETVAHIRLGISREVVKQTKRILFDLCTIVVAALIITYELLIFLASLLIYVPGREAILAANYQIQNLVPLNYRSPSQELAGFLSVVEKTVGGVRKRLEEAKARLSELEGRLSAKPEAERSNLLETIARNRAEIDRLTRVKDRFYRVITPSRVRPVVFTFVIAANLHSSFLPIFARELLDQPTFLSNFFSESVLMGLPISVYMFSVMAAMVIFGTGPFQRIRPFTVISFSLVVTASGLVFCGLSQNIVHLIIARIFCAAGLAVVVIHCRQFIVDHARPERRSLHLAGYTTAFSGGIFCSIVLGGILADYFTYRIVYFIAAGLIAFVLLFAYLVFAGQPAEPKQQRPEESAEKPETADAQTPRFFRSAAGDPNLLAVTFHGVVTRMLLVGYLYYSLPVFLKPAFNYSDIGRIMMFYGLTCVLLASFLNRRIRRAEQSKGVVFGVNIIFSAVLISFMIFPLADEFSMIIASITGLTVMGVANSLTFPAQINLLLNSKTVKAVGSRTPLAVYQSIEKVGSALGPILFGYFTAMTDIRHAVGLGGVLCLSGNLLFFLVYRNDPVKPSTAP